jgi:murein DD-endopeptidase MepM/ murein hydrolase activator NlpD
VALFKKIKERSREYYRFVIMDNATFEEKVVFKLTPLSVFVSVVIAILLLIILSISLVSFTFLREYIPGYGSTKQAQKIVEIQTTVDSLSRAVSNIEIYGKNVKKLILGEDFIEDTLSVDNIEKKEAVFSITKYDSMLMQITEHYSAPKKEAVQPHFLKSQQKDIQTMFFSPVGGGLYQSYDKSHYGITVYCKQRTSIYASATGTVIHVGYDPLNGTSLIIHYPNNTLMVYRKLGTPLVDIGDVVKAKQVIAITDFEQIVYFELWIDGIAVDPGNYILF